MRAFRDDTPIRVAAAPAGVERASYGVSLVLFIVALRNVGTARAGAYFSVAPFFGAALAVALGCIGALLLAAVADAIAARNSLEQIGVELPAVTRMSKDREAKLELRWSPQQISAWLRIHYPDAKEMRVSHETIYMSLFVQGRGALRRELHRNLRTH